MATACIGFVGGVSGVDDGGGVREIRGRYTHTVSSFPLLRRGSTFVSKCSPWGNSPTGGSLV